MEQGPAVGNVMLPFPRAQLMATQAELLQTIVARLEQQIVDLEAMFETEEERSCCGFQAEREGARCYLGDMPPSSLFTVRLSKRQLLWQHQAATEIQRIYRGHAVRSKLARRIASVLHIQRSNSLSSLPRHTRSLSMAPRRAPLFPHRRTQSHDPRLESWNYSAPLRGRELPACNQNAESSVVTSLPSARPTVSDNPMADIRAAPKCEKPPSEFSTVTVVPQDMTPLPQTLAVDELRRKQPVMTLEDQCAVRIQAAFRGYWVRKSVRAWKEAACRIQAVYRGLKERKQFNDTWGRMAMRLYPKLCPPNSVRRRRV